MLIDDDNQEIRYANRNGKIGVLVEAYRKNKKINESELEKIILDYNL